MAWLYRLGAIHPNTSQMFEKIVEDGQEKRRDKRGKIRNSSKIFVVLKKKKDFYFCN